MQPSANFSSGDTFAVAVQGFRESLYRLTFIVSGVPTQVVNGVPVSDNVGTGAYQYYTFSTVMTGQPVEVVLTRLTGDPDLVIAYGTFLPTMGRNNQTGLAFGDDVLSIPNINTPVGTVYTIGVYGSVTSSFTLVVSQNQTTSLVDGVPQAASVPSGSATSFVYYTSGNSTAPLTMLISVTTGSLEYFISSAQGDVPAYPSRTSNNWFGYATYSTPAQLTISSDSPNYLNVRGGYYIVVYANSNSSTDFTITFKSAVSVAALVDGSPAFDTVGRQQYRYYSFYVSNNSLDVTVDLTPLSGDADVFVSCNGTVTGDDSGEPSRLNYIWSSQLWGEDTITIMHTDNNSCSSSATGGTYYIAAYGFSNSSYTIVAGVDDGLPTRLSIGQPQSGQVYRGAPQLYFVSKPAGSANLTIAVSPSYGDPDVYVTLDGSTPSLTNFAYRAVGSSGVDAVTITAAAVGCALSNQSKCFCDSCDVYVSVIAFTARASYVITASTGDTTITLQDGVTYRGQVSQFAYSYFRYMNTQASASVTVSMTALSGDPDIAATQNFPNPTLSNNTWVSLRQGSDMIFANNLVIGPLYIGVFGFTNASFAIVVHAASGNSTTQLVDGQPSFGSVNATDYLFFAYSIDDAADVTFTVTPLFGSVAMYVNTCQGSSLSNCINRRPYAVNYQWNANDSLSSESIFISKTDPHACSNCLYIIGVLGNTQSDFVVMGSLSWNSTAISLQEFIPYRSYVDQWDFRYFVFTFYDTHQDVIISVTPLTGDPDLYVTSCFEAGNDSCVYQPSNTTYTWKRTSVGADTLSIPFGSLGACVPQPPNPCSYYIGVQGFTDSSFTITAYLHSDQPVLLLDGRPQNGVVNATVLDQYYMPIQPNTTGIDITLIPRSGDSDLFVTLNGEKPTQDVYQYRAISAFGNDNIEIAATDFPFVNASCATLGCQLRIAVMGFRTSEYTLIASAGTNCKSLVPGVPMRDAVSVSSYDYYCFSVDQAAPFAIVVTPLSGDPDLFVSWGSGNNKPNSTNYIWSSQRIGVDSVTVYPNDPRACPIGTVGCTYYIGVYGYSQNTSFIITAYVLDSNPVELVDGQPQNGQVDTTLLQQYVYYAPAGFGTLLVTLSPVFGDPDLYVSINSTQPPSPSHFDYASLGTSGPEVISISDSDPAVIAGCAGLNGNSNSNGDSNLCPILIGVHGFTNASFQIVAVGGNLPVDLSNGVQMYGTVNHGQYRYYVYRNTDPLATVSFAVTPFGGDPDLFVSTTNPTPTAGNCTWASTGIGRDVVEIFPEDSHYCANCNYYVGVSAWSTNASYGVVAFASGNDSVVQLVDGQPVLSLLAQGSTDQYILLAPVGVPVITITLSPLFGDADLYVNLHDYPATPHSFDYSSISASTDDIITVTSNDTAYASSPCNPANANGSSFCEVRIGVSSFSYFSYYSLLASSVNAILLLNGVSQSSSAVAGVYTQFIFENRMSNAEIDFVLTPISGDPDMYVSTSPNPNSTNFLWKANTMGVDIVQVFPLDSRSCVAPCRYYIGITGFGGSTEFTITGTSSANSVPPLLLDGRPQNDYVNASMTKLYFFDALAGTSPSFSIRVSAVYGDPDIYVRLDGTPPNASYYDFRSLSSNADDILTISTSDRKFVNCSEGPQGLGGSVCRVFIAIIGFSASQYSITASNAGNTVILQEGIPVSGQANNTGYVYYKFIASQPHAYTFTLTPVSGDPDFYISCTNSTPSLSNNTWFSNGLSSEVITIDPTNDPRAAACGMPARYFIGVTGFLRPAAYQLLVTSSCTLLQDGLPQQGQVGPYGMACFLYRATSSPGDITFQFTTLQGSVQLYVNNVLDENGNIIIPSANCTTGTCVVSNYLWTSLSSQDRSSAVVPASNTSACTNCYYAVGVLSNANATAGFSLRATAGGNVVTLSDGVPVSNIVPRGSFQYYRVVVTQPDVDIEIIATPNYGDPDLYVSWTPSNTRPNRTSYDAASTSQYNDTLYVQSVNFASCLQQQSGSGCDLYIGVYGFSNSSYTLVALLKGFNPIVLVSGVPQAMTLQAHEWVYFSAFVNLAPGQPFGFEVTPVYGDPDMYVTTDGSQPTATNNNYSSTDFGFDAVLIAPGSAGYCTRCTVVVGVVAFQSTQFSILFTLDANSSA